MTLWINYIGIFISCNKIVSTTRQTGLASYWFCQFQCRFNILDIDSWIIGYTCLLGLVTSFVHCWTGSSSINSVLTSMVCKKNWHVSIVVSHSLNHLNLKIISYQNWMLFAIYNIMMIYFDRCACISYFPIMVFFHCLRWFFYEYVESFF